MAEIIPTTIDNARIVFWEKTFITGIELIDQQHKELISLINELYRACLHGEETAGSVFKEALSRMVQYVRFHFSAEQQLLQRIQYPDYHNHKQQHDQMVRDILQTVQDYNEGKKFVPNRFVRMLADWVSSHIALTDRRYVAYISDQVQQGLLTDQQILGSGS